MSKFCKNCGAKLNYGERFCAYCGTNNEESSVNYSTNPNNMSGPVYNYTQGSNTNINEKYNTLSIVALVISILSLLTCGSGCALSIICGIVSLNHIKKYGEKGKGLAIVSIVISALAVIELVIILAIRLISD